MTEYSQRMLKLSDGKRMPLRLDEPTWKAIDWLAGQAHKSWGEWCNEVVEDIGATNLTAAIRNAAMSEILNATVFFERAEMMGSVGPAWRSLGVCNDDDFFHALKSAESTDGHSDFVGFKLTAGVNEFGKVTYYIENNVKECPSIIISTPFTLEQWEAAQ